MQRESTSSNQIAQYKKEDNFKYRKFGISVDSSKEKKLIPSNCKYIKKLKIQLQTICRAIKELKELRAVFFFNNGDGESK